MAAKTDSSDYQDYPLSVRARPQVCVRCRETFVPTHRDGDTGRVLFGGGQCTQAPDGGPHEVILGDGVGWSIGWIA